MKRVRLPDELGKMQSAIRDVLGGNGEISVFLARSKKRINTQKYLIVFQFANEQLLRKLPIRAYLLLSYIYSICDTGNSIPISVKDIAKTFNKSPGNVYGAMKQLKDCNIILKMNGKYYLSPQIGWCGSLVQWRNAMDNMKASQYVKIPVDRKSFNSKINRFNEIVPFVSADVV